MQPRAGLRLGRYPLDRHHPLNVPGQVVAIELDLQMCQTVGGDPFGQGLRQAVVDALGDVGIRQRVKPPIR